MAVLNIITLLDFLPPIHERFHLLKPVGIRVIVIKFDVDYESVRLSHKPHMSTSPLVYKLSLP